MIEFNLTFCMHIEPQNSTCNGILTWKYLLIIGIGTNFIWNAGPEWYLAVESDK